MPARQQNQQRRPAARDIVTQEGGVVRVRTDDVHEPWNLYHAAERRSRPGERRETEDVPAGMEGSYYL